MYLNIPDGNVVTPTPTAATQVVTTTTVDVNNDAVDAVIYGPVPTGKKFIVQDIIQRDASTSLTTASLSIGWNSTSYNDVVANATSTGLSAATIAKKMVIIATGAKMGAAGESLKVKINTEQGGAATVTFDVIGYLVNA